MGFFLVVLGIYVAWMVLGGVRDAAARAGGQEAGRPHSRRPDAIRRMMESLEALQREQLERTAARAPRVRVKAASTRPIVPAATDLDDEAEAVVARRLKQVERRNRMLASEEHAAFDARMRAEDAASAPAHDAAVRGTRFRDAIVWREILGPPVSLRRD